MPKLVKPQWGRLGSICVLGFEQTDDQARERRDVPPQGQRGERGGRGCALNDEQFAHIITLLPLAPALTPVELRARLNSTRENYLKALLYRATMPARRECNAALAVVNERLVAFRTAVAAMEPLPNWVLSETAPTEGSSPFRMFMTFPHRLRELASMAQIAAKRVTDRHGGEKDRALLLWSLSTCATGLATDLGRLDYVSQTEVINSLPYTRDYDMESFSDVARLTERLADAVRTALAAGRRSGGPRLFPELAEAIAELREIYEDCGGRFTHTPRDKTDYDGSPHSSAGRFVAAFFNMCDPDLTASKISAAMAQVIRTSSRRA